MPWPPDAKNWHIWKDLDPGKDLSQEEKGMTEDEMVGWHHQLNRHEFGWSPGVGDGQGGLACCSPWGLKELDMTEWLNWTKLNCVSVGSMNEILNVKLQCIVRQILKAILVFCIINLFLLLILTSFSDLQEYMTWTFLFEPFSSNYSLLTILS